MFAVQTLLRKRGAGTFVELFQSSGEIFIQWSQPTLFPDRFHIGNADPVGGENAGKGMNQDSFHPEGVGDCAGMLSPRPAETRQRVTRDVMSTGNGDLANGRGHVVDSNVEEPPSNLLQALAAA